MSDSHNAPPLSVEDIAEAWLDVHLTRVDGANAKAAARVLALVEPKLRVLAMLQREHDDIRRAIPKDGPYCGSLVEDVRYVIADRAVLQDRIAELEAELAAAKADGVRVAEEAREDSAPDTDRTPSPQAAPKTYFIQDTRQYVGNSVLWWCVDGNGYTAELSEAWEVSEEKAQNIERGRDTDKAWPADVVRAAASTHVDIQKLRMVPTSGDGNAG